MRFREVPIGAAFDVCNGATPASGEERYWDGGIPWVTPADLGGLQGREIVGGNRAITPEGFASCGTQMVPAGSIILSIRAPVGHMAIAKSALCFNQGCRGLIPRRIIRTDVAYWALLARKPQLEAAAQGTTFIELGRGKLRAERVPIPDVETQKAIADFLDRDAAFIDQLIEKKQRLVAVLGERYRTSESDAVGGRTRHADSMRDSGIDWIGAIPAHWTISRIGWLQKRITYGFTNPMPTADEGPFLLTANDINDGRILYESARHTTVDAFKDDLTDKSRPQIGDVLLTKDGTLGRTAVHDGREVCINQSVALLRPMRSKLRSDFLASVLESQRYQDRLIFEAGGTAIKHIYITRVAQMPFPLPSLAEQDKIIDEVRVRCGPST